MPAPQSYTVEDVQNLLDNLLRKLCVETELPKWICTDGCFKRNLRLITHEMDRNEVDVFGKYVDRMLLQRWYLVNSGEMIETEKFTTIINNIIVLKECYNRVI